MFKIVGYLVIILFASKFCYASTFYVRTDGNDSTCNGTADKSSGSAPNCAKRSINAAIALAYPSDSIIVHSGDYSVFTTTRAGSADKHILIKAADGETVTLPRFELNHPYTTARGFTVTSPGNHYSAGIQINASNIKVEKNKIFGNGKSSIGITMYVKGKQSNIVIDENIFEGKKTINTTFHAAIYAKGSNIMISNNIVRNMDSIERAFEAYGYNIIIKGNECYDWIQTDGSVHPDIFQTFGGDNSVVYVDSNYCYDLSSQIANFTSTGGEKKWYFRNNIFANITSSILTSIPTVLHNNLFYRCGMKQDHAIFKYTGSSVVETNNAFVGCGAGDTLGRGWYTSAQGNYNFVSSVSGAAKSGFVGKEQNGVNGGKLGFIAAFNNCKDNVCNFDINVDSALYRKGIRIYEFDHDYTGQNRGAEWSIGPHEHSSNSGIEIQNPKNLIIK